MKADSSATVMRFSNNEKLLVGAATGSLQAFNLSDGRYRESNLGGAIEDIATGDNIIAVVTTDGIVNILDSSLTSIRSFKAPSGKHRIALGRSGNTLAVTADSRIVISASGGTASDTIQMPNRVLSLCFDDNDENLFVACQGGLYSVSRMTKEIQTLTEVSAPAFDAKFSGNGKKVQYLFQDSIVLIAFPEIQKTVWNTGYVQQAAISFTGDTAIILGIRTLDVAAGANIYSLWGLNGPITGIATSSDRNSVIAVSGEAGLVGYFNSEGARLWLTQSSRIQQNSSLSANDSFVFVSTWDGSVLAYSVQNGDSLFVIESNSGLTVIFQVLMGSRLYVTYSDSTIRIWAVDQRRFIDSIMLPYGVQPGLLAASLDGSLIAASDGQRYFIYSIADRRILVSTSHWVTPIRSLDFSSDDSILLIGAQQAASYVPVNGSSGSYYHYFGSAYYGSSKHELIAVGDDSSLQVGKDDESVPNKEHLFWGRPAAIALNMSRNVLAFGSVNGDIQCVTLASGHSDVATSNGVSEIVYVHPNPARDQALICIDEMVAGEPFVAEVVSMTGEHIATLYDATPEADLGLCHRLDCSHLAAGTYFVRIASSTQGRTVKFEVVR
ncbi:MAG: hypothetical protein Q8921_13075 [Bacteroidota bacterium]|nr:hypothetical protein [Bacteroidota bacterium]